MFNLSCYDVRELEDLPKGTATNFMNEPPISQSWRWLPSRRTTRTVLAPIAAFFASALTVLTVWFLFDADETRQLQSDSQIVAEQVAARLESTISTRLTIGSLIQHELRTGEIVDEEEFARFTKPILDLFPDFQAISWVNEQGIIKWVTPLEGNEAAVDIDLRTLEVPRMTLELAEQSGLLQVTPPIELAQGGRGFVAYLPIGTVFQIRGFINIVFRTEPLIAPILQFNSDRLFHISIWDNDQQIFGDAYETNSEAGAVEREFHVGGRVWRISLTPSAENIAAKTEILDEILLVVGLVFALAMAVLIRTAGLRQIAQDRSEAALTDFAETASDWFWEMDENLRFSNFSGQVEEVFGDGTKHYIGKTRREISIDRDDDQRWQRHLDDLDAHRPIENFAYNINVPDGDPLYITINGRPVFDENGKFTGYRGTGTNMTKQRDAERRLVLAKEEAEKANHAKSEFLAHMSHELRTPLNSIIGFSNIWANETFGPINNARYLEYAKDINNASTHLLAIISDILDLSKIEAGEIDLEPEEIDAQVEVQACLAMLETMASAKQIKLNSITSRGLPRVYADRRALKQILINILSNAIKFTPPGGEVRVYFEPMPKGHITIVVTDTGIGISDRDLAKVLEPFGQSRASALVSHEGTGLGLPLAKSLTELHGGSLNIQSEEGQGTTVKIQLPARG